MFGRNRNRREPSSGVIINPHDLDLKLNLSPQLARVARDPETLLMEAFRIPSPPPQDVSPPRSCVSSDDNLNYSSSPELTPMVLAGCPRCFMYYMLPRTDLRCPKCRRIALINFNNNNSNDDNNNNNNNDAGNNTNNVVIN